MKLLQEKVENLPVSAVIFTHSHVDHFCGVKGVLTEAEIEAGNVQIVAPEHFFEVESGDIKVSGDADLLKQFASKLDNFEFWFNLVTP